MSNKIDVSKDTRVDTPRTFIEDMGSITFKEEHVREVAESMLMRSILGLIDLDGFEASVEWLQKHLNWADPKEVEYALQDLQEFGMLKSRPDGSYISFGINFDEYLSHIDSVAAQYLFSSELGQLIKKCPNIINTQTTGTYLWNEEIYRKFSSGIEILISQANMEARNSSINDMLVGFNFSMTELTRPVPVKSRKGE
ncbi:DUF4423 domain-containing protein [Bdellovibrio sp.]|uniref:DUF4423 domain-containing protein n=1 Tax=Bdellovibrio sp. TaxID=28201 RepID=UPI0039E62001